VLPFRRAITPKLCRDSERQQFLLASKVKVSQMAAKLRKVAAEMEKMANAQNTYDFPEGTLVAINADDEFTNDNPLRC
jgi:hypothetical protein